MVFPDLFNPTSSVLDAGSKFIHCSVQAQSLLLHQAYPLTPGTHTILLYIVWLRISLKIFFSHAWFIFVPFFKEVSLTKPTSAPLTTTSSTSFRATISNGTRMDDTVTQNVRLYPRLLFTWINFGDFNSTFGRFPVGGIPTFHYIFHNANITILALRLNDVKPPPLMVSLQSFSL